VRSFRDAQGRFEFPLARPGRYTLFALAAGTAALRRGGLEPTREPRELELRLDAGLALRGRVLDAASGAPIAGASVVSEDDAPAQILAFDSAQLPAELAARATTDAEGRFALERLSSGLHTLRACAPGHGAAWSARVDARTATGEIELRLGSGGTIEAQLEPPAERVPLVASAVDYGFQRPCLSYSLVLTDALGRARFEHLPPGPFVVLRVDAQATTDASFAFVREGGTSEVRLGVSAIGHALAGSLCDASGEPQRGADLMLEASDPSDEHWRSTRTDASGRFRFDGVRAGEYVLYAGDMGRNFIEVDRVRVGALDVVRALVLPAGEIAGRVRVASSASALPHAWLIVQRQVDGGWRFAGKTQADEQGSWRVRNLAPGTWRVIAHAASERLAPATSPALVVRAGGEPLETELSLAPGAALELLVREPGGEPCAGAGIELRDAQGELWQFSPADRSDAAGRFLVQGMLPGEWTVNVVKNGCADAVRKLQLEVDQQATLEIRLQPR
jgi:protocatechuate 3,4-dioxygenase beta subunit